MSLKSLGKSYGTGLCGILSKYMGGGVVQECGNTFGSQIYKQIRLKCVNTGHESFQTVEAGTEQVTTSSFIIPPVGGSTELEINWPEVGLVVLEVGLLDGAIGGKIDLNKGLSNCGT